MYIKNIGKIMKEQGEISAEKNTFLKYHSFSRTFHIIFLTSRFFAEPRGLRWQDPLMGFD